MAGVYNMFDVNTLRFIESITKGKKRWKEKVAGVLMRNVILYISITIVDAFLQARSVNIEILFEMVI